MSAWSATRTYRRAPPAATPPARSSLVQPLVRPGGGPGGAGTGHRRLATPAPVPPDARRRLGAALPVSCSLLTERVALGGGARLRRGLARPRRVKVLTVPNGMPSTCAISGLAEVLVVAKHLALRRPVSQVLLHLPCRGGTSRPDSGRLPSRLTQAANGGWLRCTSSFRWRLAAPHLWTPTPSGRRSPPAGRGG
jgi:hypothetical protein